MQHHIACHALCELCDVFSDVCLKLVLLSKQNVVGGAGYNETYVFVVVCT